MATCGRRLAQQGRLALGGGLGWTLVRLGVAEEARKRVLAGQGVSCISLHNPDPALFERCMRWLMDSGFSFISEAEVIDISQERVRPRRGAVWVSLDDGWRSNLDLLPVLERYEIPLTIFLATDAIADHGLYWWTCVDDHRSELPEPFSRRVSRVWQIPEAQRRDLVDPLIRRHLSDYARQALTVEEVRRLARSPLITLGSHTVHHPSLPQCDAHQLEEEVRLSRQLIGSWTGRPVRSFAYPKNLFDGRERDVLVGSGYEIACTVGQRIYRPGRDDRYLIPRLVLGEDSTFDANICKMVGAWRPYADAANRITSAVKRTLGSEQSGH